MLDIHRSILSSAVWRVVQHHLGCLHVVLLFIIAGQPIRNDGCCGLTAVISMCLQDLYVGFPVPESLVQQGVGGDSFAFLEMDVDFDSL